VNHRQAKTPGTRTALRIQSGMLPTVSRPAGVWGAARQDCGRLSRRWPGAPRACSGAWIPHGVAIMGVRQLAPARAEPAVPTPRR
jgi:hypothetical protein